MNSQVLYDDQATHHSPPTNPRSPPLPPTPAGEPAPLYSYGSKSTKVATVPPILPHIQTGPPPSSPQDFTPRLPPRPANSIHPSLRANPQTPTRGRADARPHPPPLRPMSPEQSPPPSPSVSSTVYETDEENAIAISEGQAGRLSSPVRLGTSEGLGWETQPHEPPSAPAV